MLKKNAMTVMMVAVMGTSLFAGTFSAPKSASAASNMVPNYEVKLLLNPSAVLGSDFKLTSSVKTAFGMPDTVTKMNVQFLDTNAEDIYNNGWSPRIRKTEGESDFELSYKKRYAITGNDINGALTLANTQGFNSGDSNYEAQIEWGYQNKTLSITRTKSGSKSGYSGMDLPNQADSRSLLINNAPDKFNNWVSSGWGTSKISSSRIYGPVLAKRSIGTWSGQQLYIEVWPILNAAGTGTEYIVEASFKTDSQSTASSKHDELITYLQSKGWFLAQDSLKTQLIMDRY
ncbi:hypothetical protein [Paenibacillus alginolyticus]|uniref:Uncharacterized protein n=1 Tax=Paenibacillus alginolyticus TaxID=59839 RepID=A0ABT4G7S7_9BACL|nr:hypothetical protein [Paenibacillus alginolyticus]MCY9692236.1 hypothetical protein [Paenibacillus alginolyticus]MEC0145923.1 hypothetical protein [Paenibacillus alginolyticus]